MSAGGYVVLTPVRNERAHLDAAIAGMLAQTVRPALWLLLDDGSSDGSAERIVAATAAHPWIRLVRLADRGFDAVGRGVAEVMNEGRRLIAGEPGEYVAKVDADVELPPHYFESLLRFCRAEPSVGICSGHPYTFVAGRRFVERHGDTFPSGTARLYRRAWLEEIGGFVPSVGWDTVDLLRMRMRGRRVRVLHDLEYLHRRRMGTRNGAVDGSVRDGRNAWLTGYGLPFFAARALYNARYRPWMIRSACMLYGYARAWWRGEPRIVTAEEMAFHRALHRRRLIPLLVATFLAATAALGVPGDAAAARRPAARRPAPPAATAAAAQESRLENGRLRLGLSAAGGAHLTSLYAVRQGRELLRPGSRTPLYQVDLLAGGKTTTLDASQATSTGLTAIDGGVVLTGRHDAAGIEVVVTIRLAPGAATAEIRTEVRRRGEDPVVGILRAPGLAFPLDAARPGPAALVPVADGELIGDLASAMRDGEVRSWNYPGMASAQLIAIQDARGGALLFCEDGTGRFKRLALRRLGRDVVPYFEHVLVDLKGPTVAVPYAVRLGVFEGDWEQAADLYRAWARTQPFGARRLESRDLPEVARTPAFFLGVNLREAAPGGGARDRTAEIPAVVAGWSKGLGMPVNAILLGWEKQGPWITPDVWPPYGGATAFGGLVGALHHDAGRALAYVSGLNVTLEKSARNGAPAYRLPPTEAQRYRAASIADQGGAPRLEGQPEGEGIGRHLVLCPTTAMARDLIAGPAARLFESGVDLVQVDQLPGGGTPPCFAPGHGHPAAGGSSAAAALAGILDSLRATAHARRPAAAITFEEPGEFFIPHVDLFHCRDYMQGLWPRDGRGSTGVPLFSYLYHEVAPGYGGDSAPIARAGEDPGLALYAQGMNLAAGRFPGAAVWMQLIRWDDVHAEQRRFMRAAADLWRSPAGRYLYGGRLQALGLPAGSVTVTGRAGGAPVRFQAPAFHARGFELADGSLGLLYINATDAPRTERLGFGPGRAEGRATSIWPETGVVVRAGEERLLPPRSILFLELERG